MATWNSVTTVATGYAYSYPTQSVSSDTTGMNLAAIYNTASSVGIIYSRDGGTTWTASTGTPTSGMISAIVSDSTGQYVVFTYATDNFSTNTGGVYRSTNYGASFSQLSAIGSYAFDYVSCSADGQVIYVDQPRSNQLMLSTDGGSTWTLTTTASSSNTNGCCSANGAYFYQKIGTNVIAAGTGTGASWSNITTPSDVFQVACDSTGQIIVYSSLTNGVYRSTDGGSTWNIMSAPTNLGQTYLSIACDSTGQVILAGDDTNHYSYFTIDAGVSWNQLNIGPTFSLLVTSNGHKLFSSDAYSLFSTLAQSVPIVPTLTSVTYVSSSSVSLNFTLGSNENSSLTDIQYATSYDSYGSWTSLGLTAPLEGYTSATISGLAFNPVGSSFEIRAVNSVGSSANSNSVLLDVSPDAPTITSVVYIDGSSVTIHFTLGSNGGTSLTDLQYATSYDGYATWTSLGLPTPLEPYNAATITGLAFNPNNVSFKMRAVNSVSNSSASNSAPVQNVPDAPTITSNPGAIDGSTVQISFSLGSNHNSVLTDIQYASSQDGYATWSSVGLSAPLEGYTSVTISGLSFNPNEVTFELRAVNSVGSSPASNALIAGLVPDQCTWTSSPIVTDNSTINVTFTLGYNEGSSLTDIQYARSIDGYTTWTSLGLTPPLEGYTSATITGLSLPPYGYFELRSVNMYGGSIPSSPTLASSNSPALSSTNWLTLSGSQFYAASCDSTGQYIAGITNSGTFVASVDYGQTFQVGTNSPTTFQSFTMGVTPSGQIIYICGIDSNLYKSTDYGVTFTMLTGGYANQYDSIVCSSDGNYVFTMASMAGSPVIVSSDGGSTWNLNGGMSVYWSSVCCSSNAQYVYATGVDTNTNAQVLYKSSDHGSTWSHLTSLQINPLTTLNSIACDSTGQNVVIAAGYDGIYRSTNYGASWSVINSGAFGVNWIRIASDASGTNLIASENSNNSIYNSSDSGLTWTAEYMGLSQPNMVAIDSSGTYRLCGFNGGITVINQFASSVTSSWVLRNDYYFTTIKMSLIGQSNQYMIAVKYNPEAYNQVSVSNNGGVSWTSSFPPDGGNTTGVACSFKGDIMYYVSDIGFVYQSTDYGNSFTLISEIGGSLTGIACDSTGTNVYITDTSGDFLQSANSGATFNQTYNTYSNYGGSMVHLVCSQNGQYAFSTNSNNPTEYYVFNNFGTNLVTMGQILDSGSNPQYITSLACSGTGQFIYAGTLNGLYVSTDYGSTWNITSMTNNISFVAMDQLGNRLLVIVDNQSVYQSLDAGVTWTLITIPGSILVGGDGVPGISMGPEGINYIVSASNPGTYFLQQGSADQSVPAAPTMSSNPYRNDSSSVILSFYLGFNGSSPLTDIQYATTHNGYATWTSLGLTGTLEGYTSATVSGLGFDPAGVTFKIRAVNAVGPSSASNGLITPTVPDAPTFLSCLVVDSATITIAFTLGSNGNSSLTDLQYASSYDSYATWTSMGLSTPLEGYSSATIGGLAFNPSGVYFEIRAVNAIGNSSASSAVEASNVPGAPYITDSYLVIVDSSTIQFDFTLGSTGGLSLTDIQYASSADSYATWTSFGLSAPFEGYTSASIYELSSIPYGVYYEIRAVNADGASSASNAVMVPNVPDAPTLNSSCVAVNSTTVTLSFTLGSNNGYTLTDIQYARSLDGFTTWTSLGLTSPLEGYTSATITGLSTPPYGYFEIRSVNALGSSSGSNQQVAISPAPDFSATMWLTLSDRYFIAASCSPNGQRIVAVDADNQVYASSDYGQTFQNPSGLPSGVGSTYYIGTASNGQTVYVCGNNEQLYRSVDSGVTFSVVSSMTIANIYDNIVCSSNGTYIFMASAISSQIVFSNDSGTTWNANGPTLTWYSLTCSSNGQYVYGVGYDGSTTMVYVSTDYGNSWDSFSTFTTSPDSLSTVACDSSGQYITCAAGYDGIYRSTDYGSTWNPIYPAYGLNWINLVSDASGMNLLATENIYNCIYTSSDGGASWSVENMLLSSPYMAAISRDGDFQIVGAYNQMTVINRFSTQVISPWSLNNGNWYTQVATSSNNQYMIALQYEPVINNKYAVSTNGGSSWTSYASPNSDYQVQQVGISLTGQVMYYTDYYAIYRSSNYGASFSQLMSAPPYIQTFACDATGTYLFIGSENDSIYVSNDSGTTFTLAYNQEVSGIHYIICSASGQYVYAVDYYNPSNLIISTNYGVSFTSSTMPASINGLVCDQSGQKLLATSSSGVYSSVDYGASWYVTQLTDPTGQITMDAFGNRVIVYNYDAALFYQSLDAGTTWTPITSLIGDTTRNGPSANGCSISSDGTTVFLSTQNPGTYSLTIGSPDTSPNWTAITGSYFPQIVYSSNNQNVIALSALENLMKYSSDGGSTWNYANNFGSVVLVGSSPSAQYVIASTDQGQSYLSTDYGHTYTLMGNSPTGLYWNGSAIDATGSKILLLGNDGYSTSYLYYSSDSGATWTNIYEIGGYLWSLAASSDFGNLYMTAFNYVILTSTDGGHTWNPVTTFTTYNVEQVACDWTGRYVVVASSSDGVYRSTDYGVTWTKTNAPSNPPDGPAFILIASNSTGNHLISTDFSNSVTYISVDAGTTWSIQPTPAGFIGMAPSGVSISPDGTRFVTCLAGPGTFFETYGSPSLPTVPCFLEGTQILCQVNGVDTYVPIETIRPGMLVKTSMNGYKAVKLIGYRAMENPGTSTRDKNSLYLCTKANYPELTADLTLTGCHAILVNQITETQRTGIISTLERIFVTDRKYRLPACVDERASVVPTAGTFTVWHFALENNDVKMNYGVYAQGLLVETSPLWHMNNKNYTLVQ